MEQIRILFRDYPLTWIVLIAILLGSIVSFLSPNFLTFMNMTNLLKQVSIVAVLAAGQTVVILSGGIDLSVGSILALTAVVIGFLIENNYPAYIAIPIGMCVGTFAGFINGIVIAKGKIPPFIATLGMMGIARGMGLVITKGQSYMVLIPFFEFIGNERIFVTYGDAVADINISKLLEFHKSHGKLATVSIVRPPSRFGKITLAKDQVIKFEEKPQLGEGWINGGFFVLEPQVKQYIKSYNEQFEASPMELLAKEGQLMAFKHEGFWHPCDVIRDKQNLDNYWKKNSAPWKKWI